MLQSPSTLSEGENIYLGSLFFVFCCCVFLAPEKKRKIPWWNRFRAPVFCCTFETSPLWIYNDTHHVCWAVVVAVMIHTSGISRFGRRDVTTFFFLGGLWILSCLSHAMIVVCCFFFRLIHLKKKKEEEEEEEKRNWRIPYLMMKSSFRFYSPELQISARKLLHKSSIQKRSGVLIQFLKKRKISVDREREKERKTWPFIEREWPDGLGTLCRYAVPRIRALVTIRTRWGGISEMPIDQRILAFHCFTKEKGKNLNRTFKLQVMLMTLSQLET